MSRSGLRSRFGEVPSIYSSAILFGLIVLGSTIDVANANLLGITNNAYIFGDSTADVGTNNVLTNPAAPKANFRPYGQNFFFFPTGRFSNGRLAVDFILQFLFLPFSTPYLQPLPFLHGNNFASGGSGILSTTNADEGIIPLATQITQFQTVASGLQTLLGPIISALLFKNSLFTFSTGNNDLFVYFSSPTLQATVPFPVYIQNMVNTLILDVQIVINAGARKIIVNGVGPIGCTPVARARAAVLSGITNPPPTFPCVAQLNAAAQAFNALLIPRLNALNAAGPATVLYGNSYNIFNNLIVNGASQGFTQTSSACCGGGTFNAVQGCGTGVYTVCPNPNQYVFWDAVHPTEAAYQVVAQELFSGGTNSVSPINIQQLSQLP